MKQANNRTRGMILKMVESVWGNLRSREARRAWAQGQKERNAAGDQIFRAWLIGAGVPDDVAKKAWAQGSRERAVAFLASNAEWIKYYNLEAEVKAAFIKHTPK